MCDIKCKADRDAKERFGLTWRELRAAKPSTVGMLDWVEILLETANSVGGSVHLNNQAIYWTKQAQKRIRQV